MQIIACMIRSNNSEEQLTAVVQRVDRRVLRRGGGAAPAPDAPLGAVDLKRALLLGGVQSSYRNVAPVRVGTAVMFRGSEHYSKF